MTLPFWILVGLIAGSVCRAVARRHGLLEDAIVGVVGAVVAGWLFVLITGAPATRLTLSELLFSLLGATLFLAISRGITRGRTAL